MASGPNLCMICGSSYEPAALFCPRDGAPLGPAAAAHPDPYLGVDLPGAIHVERLIGIGSMGRVYRAFQRPLGRAVAVKILHRELSADATVVGRFEREAQIAARLAHPNVIQVFTAGQLTLAPDARDARRPLYIVMEYLDGMSLRSALGASGTLPLSRALPIVLQLCEGVGAAHAQGIVHRDVKPENVMLLQGSPETVKVLDFGIARLPFGAVPAVTKAGLVFGTARYISPEGAAGAPVGPPADVYAIATIFYQMLAGRTPFEGGASVDILAQQMSEPPPPIASVAPSGAVPPALASTIMRNLAKKPEDREPNARSLARALTAAAHAGGLLAGVSGTDAYGARHEVGPSERGMRSGERTRPMEFAAASEGPFHSAAVPSGWMGSAHGLDPSHPDPSARRRPPHNSVVRRGMLLAFLAGCVVSGAGLALLGARACDGNQGAAVSPPPAGEPQARPSVR